MSEATHIGERDKAERPPLESITPTAPPKLVSPPAAVDTHDRITEAYYGGMGEAFMRDTQARVHWICRQVGGERVLDIGCSQGITAILLGREGKRVLGLDVDGRSIEQATGYLSQETVSVRRDVIFAKADATAYDFGRERFDTVIASEVLEHLVQPERILTLAAERLTRGGRLIVTVPFGINDYIDHKSTFYLQEPYELILRRFDIKDVVILGKWLGIVGELRVRPPTVGTRKPIDADLIATLERGFLRLERSLHSDLTQLRTRLADANTKFRAATEQIGILKQQISQADASGRGLKELVQTRDAALAGAADHRARLDKELASVRGLLDEANRKYRSTTEQVAELRAERDRNQATIAQTQGALERLTTERLDTERALARALLTIEFTEARLRDALALQSSESAVHSKVGAELATVRSALDVAASERAREQVDLARLVTELTEIRAKLQVTEATSEAIQLARERAEAATSTLRAAHLTLVAEHERLSNVARASAQATELELLAVRNAGLEAGVEAKSRVDVAQAESGELRQRASEVEAQLAAAAEASTLAIAEHQRSQEQQTSLTNELELLRVETRDRERTIEQLKIDLLRERVALNETKLEGEQARLQATVARRNQANLRATLSFQLGHALIHSTKSWAAVSRLPKTLLELRREAGRRRSNKKGGAAPAAVPESPVAVTPPVDDLAAQFARRRRPDDAARLKALKVAAISDEFTHTSFAAECDLLQLTPANWQRELIAFAPELLFVESAWRGKDDLWGNKIGHRAAELVGIVEWCRERNIPAVFWNKEDPVHFDTFLNTAKLFDVVFTTDIDCIHRYKAALRHERVYLLPFACQPALHNPVEVYDRKDGFCFAGAFYVKYPQRTRDLGNFVTTLPDFAPVDIFDRNHGKNDANYQFPSEYAPLIVGGLPFDQIDRAYKGYRYAINLNSIKQSQSMFARRVFELLACNTVTVSNYSRGLRLLFGDLVTTSDSGVEILQRLRTLDSSAGHIAKVRLAALRKVMMEHTYQHRLAYVAEKAQGKAAGALLPEIIVIGVAKDDAQTRSIMSSFERQTYTQKTLVLVVPNGIGPNAVAQSDRVHIIAAQRAAMVGIEQLGAPHEWLAAMVPDDYYAANYLLDLALATRYADAPVVGKSTHYVLSRNASLSLIEPGQQYRRVKSIAARAGAIRIDAVTANLREWSAQLYAGCLEHARALSIDEFNYCRNAGNGPLSAPLRATIDDLADLDVGIPFKRLLDTAEAITAANQGDTPAPAMLGPALSSLFATRSSASPVSITADGVALELSSQLADGAHEYIYANRDHSPRELRANSATLELHAVATPGLNVQIAIMFLDARKQRIGHQNVAANRNHTIAIPAETATVRLGLRLFASGSARLEAIILGHLDTQPPEILCSGEHLLVTNHYPSYDDLYRNAFVHRRVVAYRQHGANVDVFRSRPLESVSYHEFEGVDCISGGDDALRRLLDTGRYRNVLVHVLDETLWSTLREYVGKVNVVVWLHGVEIQPFHRRSHNYATAGERAAAEAKSRERTKFWRQLLTHMPAKLKLVFVSKYFADQVMEDFGVRLRPDQYSVIPNPIDTALFAYEPKSAEQRARILSVRPYASATYANDLSVKAILALSKRPLFGKLHFRIMGDGPLFEETVAPLRGFANVTIERRFLSQAELARLHKSYGIFLCPTRMDTHGVSRDEAMASGLVPVTSAVAAIPEFVDDGCAILAPAEDHAALADGIESLYESPERFIQMSRRATERVARRTAASKVIAEELRTFHVRIEDARRAG